MPRVFGNESHFCDNMQFVAFRDADPVGEVLAEMWRQNETDATVLILHYVCGFSNRAISGRVTVPSVSTRLPFPDIAKRVRTSTTRYGHARARIDFATEIDRTNASIKNLNRQSYRDSPTVRAICQRLGVSPVPLDQECAAPHCTRRFAVLPDGRPRLTCSDRCRQRRRRQLNNHCRRRRSSSWQADT